MTNHFWKLMGMIAGVYLAVQPVITTADPLRTFQLPDSEGKPFELGADTDSPITVVCFLGTECPMARLYGPRLSKMAEEFSSDKVQFVGVISNRQDSIADIREYVKKYKVTFPVLHDAGNKVADQFEATRTPEVFVLDQALSVVYHGRIDDQYAPGVARAKPEHRDLHDAISDLLAGKPVTVAHTIASGCLIGRVPSQEAPEENGVTFAQHVAPMLNRHCIECHRSGEIGPFPMDNYDDVAGWADTMLETIDDHRMPPWHADPDFGEFKNARAMPEPDKQLLRDWIAGGLPTGDLTKAPEPPEALTGWQTSNNPDLVLEMRARPYTVPAEGTVEYQYFVVDPGFTEDKWISDAQTMPGNRSVVHHIIVFIRPPELSQFSGIGWLTAYVPGARQINLPKGRARLIPAGSKLVFQIHYTANGEQQDDVSKLGLVFTDPADVTHKVYTIAGIDQEFEIPPGVASHPVEGSVRRMPKDAELMGIAPHMHFRGKSFKLWDGKGDDANVLLHVPNYDFNWQHVYQLTKPLPLNDVETLRFLVTFDNSDANPFNPDPTKWVNWGDQSWEEMAVAFLDVAVPVGSTGDRDTSLKTVEANAPTRQQKIDAYVTRFFEALDKDGDGQVARSEAPIVVRRRDFTRFDHDGNGYATRNEIVQLAEVLFKTGGTDQP
jgi:peroxiredoxin